MLKKIKYFFIFILVIAVAAGGYLISLDDVFKVTRSRQINAPANLVFNQIANLKNWEKWAPWKDKDSLIKFEYPGSTSKEGDYFRFTDTGGNRQKLTNLTLSPDTLIVQSLSSNDHTQEYRWQIIPNDKGVKVTWTVSGDLDLGQRLFAGQMDELMGPSMVRGLELIDRSVHNDMAKHETTILKTVELSPTYYIYKTAGCKMDSLGKVMDKILPEVILYAVKNHIETNGKPFVIYNKRDTVNNSVIFSAAVPTKEKINVSNANILTGQTPGGLYLKVKFQGDYKYLDEAWKKAYNYINTQENLIVDTTREPFEIYAKGHTVSLNPADWITYLYIPIIEVEPRETTIQ